MFNIFITARAISVITVIKQYENVLVNGLGQKAAAQISVNTFLLFIDFILLISKKMFSFYSPAVLADILMQVQLGSQKGLKTAGETFVLRARFLTTVC